MEGVGRPRQSREGKPVIGITVSAQELRSFADYAMTSGKDSITIDVGANGFKAGAKSKHPGEVFHNYAMRAWKSTPKAS